MRASHGTARALGGLLVAAALVASACGSDDTETTAESSGGETVSVATIGDAGEVLVDADGRALYSPEEEANGRILCTGSCEAIWDPLTVTGNSEPTAADGVGELGTVKRPGGGEQVTVDGAPVYAFTEEGPGEVTGDGLADSFDGQDFVWRVITATGASAGGSDAETSTSSSGGYGY